MDFRDRVVLITGASSGIGRQLAIDLATRGATVVGCGRSEERLQETLKEMRRTGPASSVHLCDVADPDQVRAMVQKILSDHGKIDILINNAGVGTYKSFVDSSSESFESVWRTNFLGAVYCIKEVLPSMIRRRSPVTSSTWLPRRVRSAPRTWPPIAPASLLWLGSARVCTTS